MEAISMWDVQHEERVRAGFATQDADPDYPALVEQADARGFAPAPLGALLVTGNEADLYTWRGRVWMKKAT